MDESGPDKEIDMHEADRRRMQLVAFIAMASVVVGAGGSPETSLTGQARPGGSCPHSPATAEPFATALSDSGRIYRGTFGPAGDELWFFKKVSADPRSEDYRIFVSHRGPTGWSPGERVDLGGEFSDLYPTLSSDGRRLVFASYRRAPGDTTSKPNAGLWMATRTSGGWSEPAFLGGVTRHGAYHSHPYLARDGTLYFRRTSSDWDTTTTLMAAPAGRRFRPPVPYAPVERWRAWREDLTVWGGAPAPDTDVVLLEISQRRAGTRDPGPSDLWMSRRSREGWTAPRPLAGGVNTEHGWENFAAVTPDGCDLIFVRDFSRFYRVALRTAVGAAQTP
jgi:hypothetical protein